MTALTRTAIGCFADEDSVTLASLTRETIGQRLIPPIRALSNCPVVTLDEEQIRRVINGQFLRYSDHGHEGPVAAVNEANQLIAVLRAHDNDHLRPALVLGRG
jgi:tRNA U55 pseudouridine synthase TruB